MNPGGPTKPILDGMDDNEVTAAMDAYQKARKAFNDKELRARSKDGEGLDKLAGQGIKFTGVCVDNLRMMADVESEPMMMGHSYPNKAIVRLRLMEEANLCECVISIHKSDSRQVIASGNKDDTSLKVKVLYSKSKGWVVTEYNTKRSPLVKDEAGLVVVSFGEDTDKKSDYADEDDNISLGGDEGNADEVKDGVKNGKNP